MTRLPEINKNLPRMAASQDLSVSNAVFPYKRENWGAGWGPEYQQDYHKIRNSRLYLIMKLVIPNTFLT